MCNLSTLKCVTRNFIAAMHTYVGSKLFVLIQLCHMREQILKIQSECAALTLAIPFSAVKNYSVTTL